MPDGRIFPVSVPFSCSYHSYPCTDAGMGDLPLTRPAPHILIYFAAFTDVMCGLAPLYQVQEALHVDLVTDLQRLDCLVDLAVLARTG